MRHRLREPFALGVLGAMALGLAIRVVYVTSYRDHPVIGDALTFRLVAERLADGHGFVRAFEPTVPTAEHPPLHELVLALNYLVGNDGAYGQMLFLSCVGTLTSGAVGLLGRVVAGPRVGVIAALLAAVYPLVWIIDGSLMSETEYMLLIVVAMLAAYAFGREPTTLRAVALGGAIALATLTRGEAVALLVFLALPLAWRAGAGLRSRGLLLGTIVLAFCVVMSPWTIRNIVTFDEPMAVLISDNSGGLVAGTNCHTAWHGALLGSWDIKCLDNRPPGDESAYSAAYRRRGTDYLRHHLGRLPVVVLARLGRMLDVFRPAQSAVMQSYEGRDGRVARWGIRIFWLLMPLAVVGAVLLRRRGQSLLVLTAPLLVVLAMSAATYGSTRFRTAAEPVVMLLAAVTLEAAWRRLAPRRAAAG